MKKIICVLLSVMLLLGSLSVGVVCFAADDVTTAVEVETEVDDGRIDLTKEGGKDHTTFWRVFAQLWIEIYYFFVDIINMAKA